MAIKTVKNFFDPIKAFGDWASGIASGIPKVLLYGSDDGGTTKRVLKTGADGALGVSLSGANGTLQSAQAGSANGSTMSVLGMENVILDITGTFAGTVLFEGSLDGTTYSYIKSTNIADGSINDRTTSAGQWLVPVAGYNLIRTRTASLTSGNVTVKAYASAAKYSLPVNTVKIDTSQRYKIDDIQYGSIPSGMDITNISGGAIASTDLAIADTADHWFIIPMAVAGFRSLSIYLQNYTAWDQTPNIEIAALAAVSSTAIACTLAKFAYSSAGSIRCGISSSDVGQGGLTGGDPVGGTYYHYTVPALSDGWPYIGIKINFAVAPTQGRITRMTLSRLNF